MRHSGSLELCIGRDVKNFYLTILGRASLLLLVFAFCCDALPAQQSGDASQTDAATLQRLLQRISELEAKVQKVDQLEARIKQLEANNPSATQVEARTVEPVSVKPADSEMAQTNAHSVPERMDYGNTLLRMRGFGDISLRGGNQAGRKTSFNLGQLNLFVTSDISERFKFLSEIVFEGGPSDFLGTPTGATNTFGVDIERMLLQYSQNDYFHLAVGRYHTAIGYYNTAFHHGTWFQTATGRPFLFQFEDQGGILPIHNVGVSASGLIPSGTLGMHYVAEIGNGRATRSALADEPVQNTTDENSHKAYNFAIFARPEAVRGLQTGFSIYKDQLTPAAAPRIDETIMAFHIVLVRPSFEWLNEGLLIRHSQLGTSRTFNTPGFYTQVSRQFGAYRPYFRYQYVNASDAEPFFPEVRLKQGPSFGVRYDASEVVALKLQYDFTSQRSQPSASTLALQVGFTF
jgi:hypothetical protein